MPAPTLAFVEAIRRRSSGERRRIVFPESWDPRTLEAVRRLSHDAIVDPVLVLDPARPESHRAAREAGVPVVGSGEAEGRASARELILQRRARRGLSEQEADALAVTPLYFADAMVHAGRAAGCVAGAAHTTGEVLRAALWTVGVAPGSRTVSSAFYMVVPPFRGAGPEVLTFTDCAVVRYPSAEQLADIALAAAVDRQRIVGDTARVAFLSFGTHGSAEGESVDLVREALALVRDRAPGLAVDGELQADAALLPDIGRRKAPGSGVAGTANVLVFPSLDAANIGYKLVQRLAGAEAIGPIVQGLAKPCSDLSRGASVDDIINVAAVTALQAAGAPPASARARGTNHSGETK